MTDPRHDAMNDQGRTDDDGALLSAWLSGELDDADTAAVDRRLAAEPELAARLERVHGTLVALRGLDAVDPPDGMADRLRDRLAEERRQVPSLASARARRTARWQPILGAAAAVALLAVLVPVLTRSASESDTTAAPAGYAQGGGGADSALEAPQVAGEEAEADGESAAGGTELSDLAGPVVTDAGERPESAFHARAGDTPEAAALLGLGLPLDEGRALAGEYEAQLRTAEPFASGACLDTVQEGLRVAVPVRVERFTVGGQARLGYVLVTASADSDVLDTIETVVADPAVC